MVPYRSQHGWSAWCSLFLAICCGAAPGCQALGVRHTPPVEDEPKVEKPADVMGHLRPTGPKGQQVGLDPRAKEIERNVGVN
jgi:hypothetical protein